MGMGTGKEMNYARCLLILDTMARLDAYLQSKLFEKIDYRSASILWIRNPNLRSSQNGILKTTTLKPLNFYTIRIMTFVNDMLKLR